jgi:hypothetical protein
MSLTAQFLRDGFNISGSHSKQLHFRGTLEKYGEYASLFNGCTYD